jgi:hypothetical protein
MCIKTIWVGITVISVLLNFYLSYLRLRPKITIDYASHLIPENPLALPIKISNQGYLPIFDLVCLTEDQNIKTNVGGIAHGNKMSCKICDKLSPNKSKDYVYNFISMGNEANIVSGSVIVRLQYKLPIIPKVIITVPQVFSIYKSKDGYTRWVLK